MKNSRCPICQKDAEVSEVFNRDVTKINCQTCGRFSATYEFLQSLPDKIQDKGYILSALTRRASELGTPLSLTTENSKELIETFSVQSLSQQMDRTLLYMSNAQSRLDVFIQPDFDHDYPLVFARDGQEFRYLFEALTQRNLLEGSGEPNPRYRLTPEGWNAIEVLRKAQPDSNLVFVAMWFDDQLKEAWINGFEPALTDTGFKPLRIDLKQHNRKIDDEIISDIRRSGLLVADLTGNRGSVYFEAGFAKGLNIEVIWTVREEYLNQVQFDTRQFNFVVWKDPDNLRKKLTDRIAATIPGHLPKTQGKAIT